MSTQTDKPTTTASAPVKRASTPRNLKPGTVVEDIYTGQTNTVKCAYWQAYAGGNTSDYTVEFEPTPEQPTGWNKSTNLRVISTPEQRTIPAEKPTDVWANRLAKAIGEREAYKAHAAKLAEALRGTMYLLQDYNHPVKLACFSDEARKALAAYEESR